MIVTPALAHAICEAFVNGAAMTDLAHQHGVSRRLIERVIRVNMLRLCQVLLDQPRAAGNGHGTGPRAAAPAVPPEAV